jgi:hypothetical protein
MIIRSLPAKFAPSSLGCGIHSNRIEVEHHIEGPSIVGIFGPEGSEVAEDLWTSLRAVCHYSWLLGLHQLSA